MRAPLLAVLCAAPALAASLDVSVISSSQKVRPTEHPAGAPAASLEAARNEFEAFQVLLYANGGAFSAVSAKVSAPLTGAAGSIPAADVVLYAERYYNVGTASNDEGGAGLWPDPLVPDVDTYFGRSRATRSPSTCRRARRRLIWVDVLVPQAQAPGDYLGELGDRRRRREAGGRAGGAARRQLLAAVHRQPRLRVRHGVEHPAAGALRRRLPLLQQRRRRVGGDSSRSTFARRSSTASPSARPTSSRRSEATRRPSRRTCCRSSRARPTRACPARG